MTRAREVLGWPKIFELAHAFLWEYSYKRLRLAQLLAPFGVFSHLDEATVRDDQHLRRGLALGFGRITGSEIEAPNILVNLV
jgi:hypothetical protein